MGCHVLSDVKLQVCERARVNFLGLNLSGNEGWRKDIESHVSMHISESGVNVISMQFQALSHFSVFSLKIPNESINDIMDNQLQ